MDRLAELLGAQGAGSGEARDLHIDAALMPAAATPELITQIDAAGPFGQSAPAPRFAFPDVRIYFAKEVGTGHLKLTFGAESTRIDAIAFNALETPMGQALIRHDGARFHLAGHLEINHWGGRQRVQLSLEDAAPAE